MPTYDSAATVPDTGADSTATVPEAGVDSSTALLEAAYSEDFASLFWLAEASSVASTCSD